MHLNGVDDKGKNKKIWWRIKKQTKTNEIVNIIIILLGWCWEGILFDDKTKCFSVWLNDLKFKVFCCFHFFFLLFHEIINPSVSIVITI